MGKHTVLENYVFPYMEKLYVHIENNNNNLISDFNVFEWFGMQIPEFKEKIEKIYKTTNDIFVSLECIDLLIWWQLHTESNLQDLRKII